MAGRLFQALSKDFLNNKHISNKMKMTVYKTIYAPTYGCENWILLGHQRRIQTTEMKYLRKVQGVKGMDKIKNKEIRIVKLQLFIQIMKEKKLG